MQDNERLFSKINVVTYLTYTFNSFKVAKFCSNYLNYELVDIHNLDLTKPINNIILVFPIHSEDAPNIIKEVVSKINSKRMIIIATFGRINHGNVIYRLKYKFNLPLVGASYFPTKHSYLKEDKFIPKYELLIPLLNKINSDKYIDIPNERSTLGYNIFPKLRARLGIIIIKKDKCNNCNICGDNCFNKAINKGIINKNCIRCLRCISLCPSNNLDYKMNKVLRLYLRKQGKNKPFIYL